MQDPQPPHDTYPTEEEISQRVYEMFLKRAWRNGSADYWTIAESELLERAARRVLRKWGPTGTEFTEHGTEK